jgi:hypothetical protein
VTERPGFVHRPERHGLVGPFSGRQLAVAFVVVVVAIVLLVAVTTPLGNTGTGTGVVNPRPTQFMIGPAPQEGLRPGDSRPSSRWRSATARSTS